MKNPKISIVTITYNSEKTVRETFESIRIQQYDNLEYIVVDGGSTDSTLKIAAEYADIITKLVSEKDDGISDAMNKGIAYATGDLIGIIHSDDRLAEGALQCLSEVWNGKADVYYGHVMVMDMDGHPMHVLRSEESLQGMEYGLKLSHPSTFVTKAAYQRYGVFNKQYKCAMDYELLLRLYKGNAVFQYVDAVLAEYRIGGTNMKLRKRTINESRNISVAYGANTFKADYIRMKKRMIDTIRPLLKAMHIHSRRVKKG